jgi:hypothetical protein
MCEKKKQVKRGVAKGTKRGSYKTKRTLTEEVKFLATPELKQACKKAGSAEIRAILTRELL